MTNMDCEHTKSLVQIFKIFHVLKMLVNVNYKSQNILFILLYNSTFKALVNPHQWVS